MDPDANLDEQRSLADAIIYRIDHDLPPEQHESDRLAELVLALDQWLRWGGRLPATWSSRRVA